MLTRAQRLEAAQAAWSDPDSGADGLAAALDAALADLGGLDGLEGADGLLARDEADRALVRAESAAAHNLAALRADRDRLRDALSALHRANKAYWLDWRQRDETLEAALATAYAALSAADSEAGT